MASSSGRRSGSSGRSPGRRTVHIDAPSTIDGRAAEARRGPAKEPRRESAAAKGRRLERERRERRRTAAGRLKVGAVVAGCVLGAWACLAVYASGAAPITAVRVEGNVRLTAERVLRVAAVPADATLLRFPAAEVEKRLEADPWILSAQVSRVLPDGMRIRVTERQPAALVDDGKSTFWLVAADGYVIARRTAEDTGTLLTIRDVERLDVATGTVTASEALLNALKVVSGMSADLRSRVRMVSAPTVDKTAVYTVDGVEIFFGDATDLAMKDAAALKILKEQAGKVVYINVRSVARPTWRGLGDTP
ncbi:MAG: FtsQ-type POTRA domain-containing protein [Actinobacteria bacterium]|nr:MAG: FtsQ-type POTRA domain-containing protein [Actinomycetota bacterium]